MEISGTLFLRTRILELEFLFLFFSLFSPDFDTDSKGDDAWSTFSEYFLSTFQLILGYPCLKSTENPKQLSCTFLILNRLYQFCSLFSPNFDADGIDHFAIKKLLDTKLFIS